MEQSNILITACRNNDTDCAKEIMELYPCLVNLPDHQGWLPIHHAALNRNVHLLGAIVKQGGDLHATTPSKWTCLHFAAFHGDVATIEYLLSKNLNINAQNNRGWTPLHIMVAKNNEIGISLLLANGANISIRTAKGETPIQLAQNRPKIIV